MTRAIVGGVLLVVVLVGGVVIGGIHAVAGECWPQWPDDEES
jgi:hypothetical protein